LDLQFEYSWYWKTVRLKNTAGVLFYMAIILNNLCEPTGIVMAGKFFNVVAHTALKSNRTLKRAEITWHNISAQKTFHHLPSYIFP